MTPRQTTDYPPELRETRLRVRVDELAHQRDRLAVENKALRRRLERKDLVLAAMRADEAGMAARIKFLERQLDKRANVTAGHGSPRRAETVTGRRGGE